ncbi:hypothetical protein SAMN04489761_3053 [Tenacibaculum sp. MAR_2009_124]|uniref:hypothetical protein n=1 Tax=Tenacibaculum sp. MAR_2009_124 TaxID=1250059 RepID=UPI0008986FFB|nr:hypothetical protein [Tenacibaculum sp. MAR_2009_124]SEC45963.1 hypothetical protein SAMN04489761_3053 [Tenacibaculum sp. MAR_2009_124]
MTIDDWLSSEEQDYKTALALYEALPNCNKYFLKAMQKESRQNLMKLKYQLEKNKHLCTAPAILERKNVSEEEIQIKSEFAAKPSYKPSVQIKDLPFELHPVYTEQKNNFALACSLKMQLNTLQEHEIEYKALDLIIKIDALFKTIKEAWKIIDYYTDHKEVIQIPENDLENLNLAQLSNKKNSLRSSITRQKARKEKLQIELKNTVLRNKKLKLEANILKSKKKLLELESSLSFVLKLLVEK